MPTTHSLTHGAALIYLAGHPGAEVEFSTRDATGTCWIAVRCWLDADGSLVQLHPTDIGRHPIAAPLDVTYRPIPASEVAAERADNDARWSETCST
jgi:hypothetical protein